jgi:fructoselysine transporter
MVWTAMGVVAYLIWARYEKVWPFGPKEIREVFVEEKSTFTQSGQIHG